MNFPAIRNLAEFLSLSGSFDDIIDRGGVTGGFQYVGGGSFRAVFSHESCPDVVFKMRRWDHGCNSDEFDFYWFDADDIIRGVLAIPIYLSRNSCVLVQEKVDEMEITHEEFENVLDILPHDRTWDVWKTKNVGKVNDRVAVFDYANIESGYEKE